jgi:hypothetical protein
MGGEPEPAPCGGAFGPGPALRDRILEHLRSGQDSISGIARAIAADRERPLHRLTVAGYLAALEDQGLLRGTDVPPSRQYRLANATLAQSLHQRLAQHLRTTDGARHEQAALLATALTHLLRRPIFAAELTHAGFPGPYPLLQTVQADEAERRRIRSLFQRRIHPAIQIPRNDPLLRPPSDAWMSAAQELIGRSLLAAADAAHLAVERPPGRQMALP